MKNKNKSQKRDFDDRFGKNVAGKNKRRIVEEIEEEEYLAELELAAAAFSGKNRDTT